MELHPIIPVSIDDTLSLNQNTMVFSLAAFTVIITYTTVVWSAASQNSLCGHKSTPWHLRAKNLAHFSLHKKNSPHSLRSRLPCHSRCPCQHITTLQNTTLEDSTTPPPVNSSVSHSFRSDSLSTPYFLFLAFVPNRNKYRLSRRQKSCRVGHGVGLTL